MTTVGEPEVSLLPDDPTVPNPVVGLTPSRHSSTGRRKIQYATVVALTILAGWFALYATVLSGLQEQGSQSRLYAKFRGQLAAETADITPPIPAGAPVALLSDRSGILKDLVVVEGTTASELERGPGHLADTPLPGQVGTAVLMGRALSFGAPFGHIGSLKTGDPITVTTQQGIFVYRVDDVRRQGSRLPPSLRPNGSRVVLVSASGQGWRSGWAPSSTIYVDADLVKGSVQSAPANLTAPVSSSARPMGTDKKALAAFLAWLEALILVAAVATWIFLRWEAKSVWIVATPVILVLLWTVTSEAMLFLPNLL